MGNPAALEPLERLVAGIIDLHPEYHPLLDRPTHAREAEFGAGSDGPNPFLHMGLHIALIEQLQTDRPAGIRALYQQLLRQHNNDNHGVEHRMMACLGNALAQAGERGAAPDEQAYLAALRDLLA